MRNNFNDKELLQAKHRLEEAQARNRQKERKARTRRLIQEGAILENVLPEIKHMNPDEIKNLLLQRLLLVAGSLDLFPEGRTYSPLVKRMVVLLKQPCALRGLRLIESLLRKR